MAKIRLVGALCLCLAASHLDNLAEQAIPTKQCFVKGDIIEISTKMAAAMVLSLFAILLNLSAEKSLSRRKPAAHEKIIMIFVVNAKAIGQPNSKPKLAISSNECGS